METFLKKNYQFIISILLIITGTLFAQDTVDVAPGFNVLQSAIDANPGKVLRLQRGGIYTNDTEIQVNSPLILVGEKEPRDIPPPLINLDIDPGQADSMHTFSISTDFEVHYIGFNGFTVDDESIDAIFNILKPNITFTLDHCTIQSTNAVYWAGRDSLMIIFTNNTFWGLYNNGWWDGGYLGNWLGNEVTFKFVNNTVIGAGGLLDALGIGPHGIELFDHNTYVNVNRELYYTIYIEDFIVTNNIMYNVYHRGVVGPRSEWGFIGDILGNTYDTLRSCIELYPFILLYPNEGIDDYARDIRINNNLRYTSNDVFDYMKDITASWQPMFSAKIQAYIDTFGWKVENNLFEEVEDLQRISGVDPQFEIDPNSTPLRDKMDEWNLGARDASRRDPENWPPYLTWYPTNPATGKPFKHHELIWPITDFLNFKPLNKEIWFAGDDGFPLGDLNWFRKEVMDAWLTGKENPLTAVKKQHKLPSEYYLYQNYPNPFNPSTIIRYSIPSVGTGHAPSVRLVIYNVLGQIVTTLVNEEQKPGNYEVKWDGAGQSSGVYFYKLQSGNFSETRKLILLR